MKNFTSDTHFFHTNIVSYCNRPFADLEAMHEGLIANWNAAVEPTDEIFILGDLSFGSEAMTTRIVEQLQGTKHIVLGNHDRAAGQYTRMGINVLPRGHVMQLSAWGFQSQVRLHHYPYGDEDHTGIVRGKKERPIDDGMWLLHGHIHELRCFKDRMINVGVDQWNMRPVSETILMGHIITTEKNKHGNT